MKWQILNNCQKVGSNPKIHKFLIAKSYFSFLPNSNLIFHNFNSTKDFFLTTQLASKTFFSLTIEQKNFVVCAARFLKQIFVKKLHIELR